MKIKKTCHIKKFKFLKRKVYIITPKKQEKTELVIMYLHGGAYAGKITKNHWNFVKDLCDSLNCTIILPDYPLTPKHYYIDVFNMMELLYDEILLKINPDNYIILGDSAGGGLGLALLEKKSQEGKAIPSKLILISPWLDITMSNPKIDEIQKKDKVLNKIALKLAGEVYTRKEESKNNYLVNPINGPIENLKNVTIFTGTYDILNPDVHLLKEKAIKKGIDIQIKEVSKAVHNWIIENDTSNLKQEGFKELIKVISNRKV